MFRCPSLFARRLLLFRQRVSILWRIRGGTISLSNPADFARLRQSRDDLADSAFALVQICPTGQSRAKAFRLMLTATPGQWTRVESNDVAITSTEVNWRTPQAWLKEALWQAGYRDLPEEELTRSAKVMGSALTGPKGVILKGQIKSLIVHRNDIVNGYKVSKERPKEWIRSSELPPCATFENGPLAK